MAIGEEALIPPPPPLPPPPDAPDPPPPPPPHAYSDKDEKIIKNILIKKFIIFIILKIHNIKTQNHGQYLTLLIYLENNRQI